MNCSSEILFSIYFDLRMNGASVLRRLLRTQIWEPSSNTEGPEYLTKLIK